MFNTYSMCPGGAMMICESISEYDANMPTPPAPPAEDVFKASVEMDPVVAVKSELGKLYNDMINPLLTLDVSGKQNAESMIRDLDFTSQAISKVMEKLYIMVLKKNAMCRGLNGYQNSFIKSEFLAHRGEFIRNASKVHQQGIESFNITTTKFPAVCDWDTERIVLDVIDNLDEFSNCTIISDQITALVGASCSLAKSFRGFRDLNNCLFSDFDRFARLESTSTSNESFDYMLRDECHYVKEPNDNDTCCRITAPISRHIRKSKCSLYEMSCAVMDGTMTPDWYNCEMKRIINSTYNLFTAVTIYIFKRAYDIRNAMEYKQAIDNYVQLLLKTIKSV